MGWQPSHSFENRHADFLQFLVRLGYQHKTCKPFTAYTTCPVPISETVHLKPRIAVSYDAMYNARHPAQRILVLGVLRQQFVRQIAVHVISPATVPLKLKYNNVSYQAKILACSKKFFFFFDCTDQPMSGNQGNYVQGSKSVFNV